MEKCKKIKDCFIIGLLFFVSLGFASVPQTKVISPVEGTWANPQALIIDNEPGTEVFYSLNGEDPLVSGFAYDGPVLLEGTGNFSLTIVSVSKEGTSIPKTVEYTVEKKALPSYIKNPSDSPIIPMYKDSTIKMPTNVSWFVGTTSTYLPEEKLFQKGGDITLYSNCDIVNYIPLVIKDGSSYYRYVLKTGYSDSMRYSAPVPSVGGIEFFAWNYIRLLDGEKAVYSIDDGAWKETTTLIVIDRTKNHTIKWQKADKSDLMKVFYIPAKPQLIGLPEKGFTNEAVKLKLDSKDYQIGYNSPDGNLLFTKELTIDTVTGDCASIATDFDIYFQGIKMGTITPVFLIDRRNPVVPEIISTAENNFSRKDVTINFDSNDEVYYSVSAPIYEENGFESFDSVTISSSREKTGFIKAENNEIILPAKNDAAVFYTVFAYAKDISGNCSDIISYSTIIDSKNYYVDSKSDSKIPHTGTKSDPYPAINDAIRSIVSNNVSLYLDGSFVLDKSVTIGTNCNIIGTNDTKLQFTSNAQLIIENGNVFMENCTLEKQVPQSGDVIQKNLLKIYNSTFVAKNCEFICYFDYSGNCITSKDSTVTLEKSGLSIQATSYASLINAENTLLNLYDFRGNSSAKTAVGISAAENTTIIDNSEIKVIGSYTRACEFLSVVWNIQNSSFISQNAKKTQSAIWMDAFSTKNVDFKNTIKGFSSLFVQSN
jgi:hypothetical protein